MAGTNERERRAYEEGRSRGRDEGNEAGRATGWRDGYEEARRIFNRQYKTYVANMQTQTDNFAEVLRELVIRDYGRTYDNKRLVSDMIRARAPKASKDLELHQLFNNLVFTNENGDAGDDDEEDFDDNDRERDR